MCNGSHAEKLLFLHYAMFDQSGLDPDFVLSACHKCGFVYYDTCVTRDALSAYYRKHLFYDSGPNAGHTAAKNLPDAPRFEETAELISKHLPDRSTRIVDIGANNGEQLMALKRTGYISLCGVDMRQSSVQTMKQMGMDAYIGAGEALPPNMGPMGLCIMSHTLEHMVDPMAVLSHVSGKLADDGMLYIEVPDAAGYPMDDLSQWYKFAFYEHLNHFDLDHLETMANLCGFEGVELGQKMIAHRGGACNQDNRIASVFGLFKKGERQTGENKYRFDTAEQLQSECNSYWCDPSGTLKKISRSKSDVYLWGISQFAQLMLGSSPLKDCERMHLVDRDTFKQRQTINGLAICDPSMMQEIEADDIVLFSDKQVAPAMKQYLNDQGLRAKAYILGDTTV